jgi:ABC-type transport system involved in cytochrome bd biosynthesis fused ATPase/permease subunit
MFTHINFQIETVLILAAAALLLHWVRLFNRQKTGDTREHLTEDYLYKMARITGASEYEIFQKSAAEWPVSEAMVEKHFKDYLRHQATPCYVNDFIRKHKQQVDSLKLPPF